MQALPIGIYDFISIRKKNRLYVDKTKLLAHLIDNNDRIFLARPRRFGKSLTISTLKAMFQGKAEYFENLYAKEWMEKQDQKEYPVIHIDMSQLKDYDTADELNFSIVDYLKKIAKTNKVNIGDEKTGGNMLVELFNAVYEKYGDIVVLIDEYDKPILDNINNYKKLDEIRSVLYSFYSKIKSYDSMLNFVFITGISKFSKIGIFSGMNNLRDISFSSEYNNIVGYTQEELETNFREWIVRNEYLADGNYEKLISMIKHYYDGFSFDGVTKLYNPFSIHNFFRDGQFENYWYQSGCPTFIVKWMEKHQILDPEEYRHKEVDADFANSQEIENASPENFLYQSGYLTIEKRNKNLLTLDIPNIEVLNSLSKLYLELVYRIKNFGSLGSKLWNALEKEDIFKAVDIFNTALANIPYEDFSDRDEFWYRSLFVMLLRGASVIVFSEVHTFKGRSDIVIHHNRTIFVIEFKFAKDNSELKKMKKIGKNQLHALEYAKGYKGDGENVVEAVIVANDKTHQTLCVVCDA